MDRDHQAFVEVGGEARDNANKIQDVCEVIDVTLDGSHEDRRVIHIEGGAQHYVVPTDFVKQPFSSYHLKDLFKRVNSDDKE